LARRDRPVVALLRRHWRKFGAFGTIGFTVFLAGLALQVALVRLAGMGNVTSYVIKTLASVQLSLLLNRYLTWRDRDILMIRAAALFNVQQLTIQGIGVAAYAGLVLCVPKTSSMSCDQAVFVDQAAGVSLPSDAVPVEIDRFW
jgi:putative flippase GtrA